MTSERASEAALQRQIEAEQIAILFRNMPYALASNLLLASSLVWVLWDVAGHGTLLGWWAVIVLLALVRMGLVIGYHRRRPDCTIPWHIYLTAVTTFSGAVWGAAGLLFFIPDSPIALIFVTIILASIAAGSVPAYSSWPMAQYGAVPTVLPMTLRYLFEGGEFLIMGFMSLLYLFNVLVAARHLSRVLHDAIRLRLEKQELAHQLQEEKLAAEEANRAKSRFLAAASHDLRQPLHAVNLFVEALRQEKDPARTSQILEHLSVSTRALEELLNELLDISKLEAGLFRPEIRTFHLQELFDSLERELRPVAEEKGIELGFVATHLQVRSDPHMLGRILRNIITNAIQHTEAGAVLVGCRRKRRHAAIAVYDTGPGIAPEHHRAIFREFYQLGNPERDRRKGLGLGLAIVDGLCRVLGHPLELRSRLGRGSAFFVRVPIAVAEAPDLGTAQEPDPSGLQGCSVLVIDDEPAICQAMTDVLTLWGCRVLSAESAQEALTRMAETGFVPEAIIADYRLRGYTGTEAIAAIRHALGQTVPAAILTGDTAPERLREASASGLLLLHKPVQPARLRAALTNLRQAPSAPAYRVRTESAAPAHHPLRG